MSSVYPLSLSYFLSLSVSFALLSTGVDPAPVHALTFTILATSPSVSFSRSLSLSLSSYRLNSFYLSHSLLPISNDNGNFRQNHIFGFKINKIIIIAQTRKSTLNAEKKTSTTTNISSWYEIISGFFVVYWYNLVQP